MLRLCSWPPPVGLDDVDPLVVDRHGVAPPALEVPTAGLALGRGERLGPDVLRVVVHIGRLPRDEVEVVRERRPHHRREEVVAQRVLLRPVPVRGDLRPVELRVRPWVAVEVDPEVVELAVVVLGQGRAAIVPEVAGQPVGAAQQRLLLAEHVADRGALDAGEPSEEVVEAPVLEHQVDHALDRPPGVQAHRRGARRAHARRRPSRRCTRTARLRRPPSRSVPGSVAG